jgi:hypothetical protein
VKNCTQKKFQMSELTIPEVSSIPRVTQSTYTVERVNKNSAGDYVSLWTTYTVTVYDHSGRIVTTHSNNTTLGIA